MSLHYRDGYQLNPFIPSKSGAETNLSDFYFARACLHLARVCLHLASFVSIQPGFVLEMDQIRVQKIFQYGRQLLKRMIIIDRPFYCNK